MINGRTEALLIGFACRLIITEHFHIFTNVYKLVPLCTTRPCPALLSHTHCNIRDKKGKWGSDGAVKWTDSRSSPVLCDPPSHPPAKMSRDYFGFSYLSRQTRNGTSNVALNNAADISVIVIYFLVVLAVGVWVSSCFILVKFDTKLRRSTNEEEMLVMENWKCNF